MMTEAEIRQKLREWVVRQSGKIRPEELADDTAIIEKRIIKSVRIPDLILSSKNTAGARSMWSNSSPESSETLTQSIGTSSQ